MSDFTDDQRAEYDRDFPPCTAHGIRGCVYCEDRFYCGECNEYHAPDAHFTDDDDDMSDALLSILPPELAYGCPDCGAERRGEACEQCGSTARPMVMFR